MGQGTNTNDSMDCCSSAPPRVLFGACNYIVKTQKQRQISSKLVSIAQPWLAPVQQLHITNNDSHVFQLENKFDHMFAPVKKHLINILLSHCGIQSIKISKRAS